METQPILYKKLEPVQIAFLKAHIQSRDEIPRLLNTLRSTCQNVISGAPLVIIHGGAAKTGLIIEAAIPVTRPVATNDIQTRLLEAAPVLSLMHTGSHQTIRDTVLKIYAYLDTHALTTSLLRREIYHVLDESNPDHNETEVQLVLHEWERLLAEGAERILGSAARQMIMSGVDSIDPATSFTEYVAWIQGAVERLDALPIDDEQKCQVVSHCAHVFPQERIDHLRAIYEHGTVDDVLREMYQDDFWYEKPVRRDNVIYMRKNPYNPEGYENATTPAERRKAYCHCSFVHPYLDEIPARLSPTFCFCGAGWYRRLWEGILGQPVKIEHVETLLKGHDHCTLTITLPLSLSGECTPELSPQP
ncbi:MAG TPA: hypothetical protein PKG95_13025 [Anaerolineaceae bacterium]|nr:hypothetical protein [Anaerolineaceae bacterium]